MSKFRPLRQWPPAPEHRCIGTEALTSTVHIIDSHPRITPVIRARNVPTTQRRKWLVKMAREVE